MHNLKLRLALLAACATLAGCASNAATYNAQTTYDKLAGAYPFIRIASATPGASVRALTNLTYVQYGERSLQLDLYLPAKPASKAVPGIVFVHGGGWRSGSRENFAPMAIRMAERGYAAATVSYRLAGEALYPAAVEDVKAAVGWMRANAARYGIDAGHIALAGGSAGGQIASLAGLTGGAVQAVVNIDGLSDFTSEAARQNEDDPAKKPSAAGAWFGGTYAEKTALWREASPTFHVTPKTPPMLFIGSSVARFSVGREEMVERLNAAGVANRVVLLPQTPHSFWLFDPWLEPTVEATAAFLGERFGADQPWLADLGNGKYRNPVLHADYSDPDVIRVGDTFYMTSSSFSNVPGLPLLESKDMVNWELVGHALARLVPAEVFATPQPGKGVWAPCLRFHDGKFWIFYPDPDFGIYVMTAEKFAGPWSAPHLLVGGKGLIDPAPLWDDDGKAYLLHGWAKSRAGINNMLTLRRMAPDARSLENDGGGKVVIDGNKLPGYGTLEGPKFYKANGYYYVFAPAGGVETGWQSVFRSRRIDGPYEDKIVMAQGATPVNGPHQGAWVSGADGRDWFFHFQDKRAYGRVLHLQPMRWQDGWPIIGEDSAKPGVGQPVLIHDKPVAGNFGLKAPPASDDFSLPQLGLQWQWNSNWEPHWYSLSARPGYLRLQSQASAPVLSQKLPAPAFSVTTRLELHAKADGDRAGLILNGLKPAWLGLRQEGGALQLVLATDKVDAALPVPSGPLQLRMTMAEGGLTQFSYSLDQQHFIDIGKPFSATMGRWVGAQVGLFSASDRQSGAFADVDYFKVTK